MADLTLLKSVLDKTSTVLAGVKPEQSTLPTPCPEFDVAALVDHMYMWIRKLAAQASGHDVAPDISWDDACRELLQGLEAGTVEEAPAPGLLMTEYISHGWDLATATGQAVPYSDEEAAMALDFSHGMLKPEYRGDGQPFGPELTAPEGASALVQFLAFVGRQA